MGVLSRIRYLSRNLRATGLTCNVVKNYFCVTSESNSYFCKDRIIIFRYMQFQQVHAEEFCRKGNAIDNSKIKSDYE